jgi:hypothetical protein
MPKFSVKPQSWAVPFLLLVSVLCAGQAPLLEPVTDQESELGLAVYDAPKSEPQQTAAVQPKPGLQQEANAAPPESDDINVVSALPTVPADSFDSRWHGFQ